MKLAKKRAEGRGGWDDPAQCKVEDLARMLVEHLPKGDPVDVANFCMMLHQRGECILPAPQATVEPLTDERIDAIQNAAFRELAVQGYSGGMGGETWDRASARAIERALLAATPTASKATEPAAWGDAMRWSGCNHDFHGYIAFTPDQLKKFVSLVAPGLATSKAAKSEWRCFHCEEIFDNREAASKLENLIGRSKALASATKIDSASSKSISTKPPPDCDGPVTTNCPINSRARFSDTLK